jgi:hypothetical protein
VIGMNVIDEIKIRVLMREAMDDVGWRRRGRGRYDCGLCHCRTPGCVAVRDEVWYCHHCHAGGSVIDLIMHDHRCNLSTALEYLAQRAGVRLEGPRHATEAARLRRQVADGKRQRQQIDNLCEQFAVEERDLRLECCRWIHVCDRILSTPTTWDERRWHYARVAYELRNEFLLPEYNLLSFGPMDLRILYVRANEVERAGMLEAVRWSGLLEIVQ